MDRILQTISQKYFIMLVIFYFDVSENSDIIFDVGVENLHSKILIIKSLMSDRYSSMSIFN